MFIKVLIWNGIINKENSAQWFRTPTYRTLSSWTFRLLDSWLISSCLSSASFILFFRASNSLSEDCSTRRRSRISLLRTARQRRRSHYCSFYFNTQKEKQRFWNIPSEFCFSDSRLCCSSSIVCWSLSWSLFLFVFSVESCCKQIFHEEVLGVKRPISTSSHFEIRVGWTWLTSSFCSDSCDITAICSSSFAICCSSLLFFISSSFSCDCTRLDCSWGGGKKKSLTKFWPQKTKKNH